MMMPMTDLGWGALLFWSVLAYGFGSIPSGVIIARLLGLGDLRQIGSGNIGATNVLRTGNKNAAALTLLFDAGKGALPVLLGFSFAGEAAAHCASISALLGHCYPVWLRFKGGKAVATLLGVLLALFWPLGLLTCLAWLVAAAVFRISSLAALIASLSTLLWAMLLGQEQMIALLFVLNALVYWRHRANIARLLQGSEPKIGQK